MLMNERLITYIANSVPFISNEQYSGYHTVLYDAFSKALSLQTIKLFYVYFGASGHGRPQLKLSTDLCSVNPSLSEPC